MESLVVPPTAKPQGSLATEDEFFFLKLSLRYTMDSASQVGADPIETELFGVETRVKEFGFYSGLFGNSSPLVSGPSEGPTSIVHPCKSAVVTEEENSNLGREVRYRL